MRQSSSSEAFLRDHEWVRFVLLLGFMFALASFAAWRVAVELADHRAQRVWLVGSLVAGAVVALVGWPTVFGVSSKHPPWGPAKALSRSARNGLAVALSLLAVVALLPKHNGPVQFWQPGWVQLLGSGFWLCFAGLVVQRRVRQRAWRGFAADEHRL